MWNTFMQSKNAIAEKTGAGSFSGGLSKAELLKGVKNVADQYGKESISRIKSEMIGFLLTNCGVKIIPENIFAHTLEHFNIMWDFPLLSYAERKPTATDKAWAFQNDNVFRANMDFGHVAPDWQYVLDKGISGIIADLKEHSLNFTNSAEKSAYYSERILVFEAIKNCFLRISKIAWQGESEKEKFISENYRVLAENPPKTLAQAMQLILFFYLAQTDLDKVTIRSLGGLDRLLYPFYKSDLESGKYTEEQLGEITKYFLWNIFAFKTLANLPFYVCGLDNNGEDATNEFTNVLLEKYDELGLFDPKIHVLYHKEMNSAVLDKILTMIRDGKNSFVFVNTTVASKSLERIGISKEDAKRVTVYGCYEAAAEGTEVPCTCGGMVNMAKAVEMAVNTGKDFTTFREFFCEVMERLEEYTTLCMDTIAGYEPFYSDVNPSLLMSPTYKSSRECGIDLYEGGAKYNNTSVVGAGLATLVDSLIAVKHVVFDEKKITFSDFSKILQNNWQNEEKLRLTIKKKYAKFGNDVAEADALAIEIYNRFTNMINGRKNGRGGVFRCGMFSVDWRFWMGEKTAATPDGRFKGEPISKNLAAAIGQDKRGVTAYLKSVLKFDSTKTPDGYVADVVLHSSAVKGEEGFAAFKALLITFMEKGGFSVHFNVLNPKKLMDAQKEPEKYQNLQIRLCGWNVRFVDLDKAQQDEFIKQSANSL